MTTNRSSNRRVPPSTTSRAKASSSPSPSTSSAEDFIRTLRVISKGMGEHSRLLSRQGQLTVPQLLCMRKIGEATRRQRVTVANVSEAVQLSMANVSRILDRLVAAGLVLRERSDEDRRKVFLKLTPEGRKQLKRHPLPLQLQFIEQFEALPAKEQQQLLCSLETIVSMMETSENRDMLRQLGDTIGDDGAATM